MARSRRFHEARTVLRATTLLGVVLAACAAPRPLEVPMRALWDRAPATQGPRVLLVMLPGRGDTPDDLVRNGMVAEVRARHIAADVVVADAHYGYFMARQTTKRVWQDIIAPARAEGYDGVWLAGISIGGLGALLYAARVESSDADPVAGVLAIAPVIGSESVLEEVAAAGGLRAWQPSEPYADYSHKLWAWLRGYGDASTERPQLYLGVGTEDRFRRQTELVAPVLPEDHVIEVPGAHTWRPWLTIWGQMLDRAPLPRLVP
ncbi:MAG TPA: alpha/beta hydrolase [Planctomycetota bacterium]|nr:alpha/beta hydrolase [Planctomycetota bacterium]